MSDDPNLRVIEDFVTTLWLEDGLSKNSQLAYRRDLKQLSAWSKKSLLTLEPVDVQTYLSERFLQGKATSSNRRLTVLKRFYQFAIARGLTTHDQPLICALRSRLLAYPSL